MFFLTLTISAQAPQGFNYQATVRNNAGALMVNQNVTFKFNVIKDTPTSVPIFSETHYVPTDDLGAVNLVIGKGTATTGTFATIDWATGTYYLGIELNTGNGFKAMGTSQLLSVPYALYANKSGDETYQPWSVSQQKDSISFTKKVVIGDKNSVNVPPLTIIGTDSGPTSSSIQVVRSQNRNNVIVFAPSEPENLQRASLGVLQKYGPNEDNVFTIGVFDGTVWNNPFKIYTKNRALRYGITSDPYSLNVYGNTSLSLGYDAKALGDYSNALGYGATSNSYMETAIGNFNTNYNPIGGRTNYNLSDRLLVIGKGTSNSNRSNALIIKKSGEMSLEGNQIKNLLNPTDNQDAATKSYVDSFIGGNASADSNRNIAIATTLDALDRTTIPAAGSIGEYIPWTHTPVLSGYAKDNLSISVNGLKKLTTGQGNIAIGTGSLKENTNAAENTAVGYFALSENISNGLNTAFGSYALMKNSDWANTAVGHNALTGHVFGWMNVAMGNGAMQLSLDRNSNTAIGGDALRNGQYGDLNTAVGIEALMFNGVGLTQNSITSGSYEGTHNTGVGAFALRNNTLGMNNSSLGFSSLQSNTTGVSNTAVGADSSKNSTTGSNNTSLGAFSFRNNTTGNANTTIGTFADVASGNLFNATAIGSQAIVNSSNTIQLGDPNVTDVKTAGKVTASGFKTPNGTGKQYLMADGSVLTIPKKYRLEYISGDGQIYSGGGMPSPMVFKIFNITDNIYVTSLIQEGLSLNSKANIGYEDANFNNLNNYCNSNDSSCFGGYYFIPSTGLPAKPFNLIVTVTIKYSNTDEVIDRYIINQYIQ